MTRILQAFELDGLEEEHAAAGSPYSEFLRRRGVSMGMYTLPAGTADRSTRTAPTKVYIVLRGRGTLQVVDTDHEVKAGSIVSVDHGEDHRFTDVAEDLQILVVFAPAEHPDA